MRIALGLTLVVAAGAALEDYLQRGAPPLAFVRVFGDWFIVLAGAVLLGRGLWRVGRRLPRGLTVISLLLLALLTVLCAFALYPLLPPLAQEYGFGRPSPTATAVLTAPIDLSSTQAHFTPTPPVPTGMVDGGRLPLLTARHLASWALLALLAAREVYGRRRRPLSRAALAAELARVDALGGAEFERYVAWLLRRQGFQVKEVGGPGDLGVDLVAQKGWLLKQRTAIQTKCYSGNVDRKAVSDVVAAMKYHRCTAAMVVTNRSFMPDAAKLAASNGCRLVNREGLTEWIRRAGRPEATLLATPS